jgi:hypothetical protein
VGNYSWEEKGFKVIVLVVKLIELADIGGQIFGREG